MGFIDKLKNISDVKILENEPMKKHTYYMLGGNAKYFIEVKSLFSLNEIIKLCVSKRVKYFVLGNGSNVLCSDKGFNGVVISTKNLNEIYFNKDKIHCGSGVKLNALIEFCTNNNLSGLEYLTGIPASIGGAVKMNAGAFNHNISECVYNVSVLEKGIIKNYSKEECKFSYRKSTFNKNKIIVACDFCFTKKDKKEILVNLEKCKLNRNNSQPKGRSCGSVFKNKKGVYVGKLIEDLGLKNYCIGGARISPVHANFIIAENNAKAIDVYNLIKYVKNKVKEVYNIKLKEEVIYLGEF